MTTTPRVIQGYPQYCVLVLSRGKGPRALENWLQQNTEICFGKDYTLLGNGRTPLQPVLATQFYSAYLQSLVLCVNTADRLEDFMHIKITLQCLVKGRLEHAMVIRDSLDGQECETMVDPIKNVSSNTAGYITLVNVSNALPIRPRQFRRHLKIAGFPVLGNAKDATAFRGESLCMAMTNLEFQWKDFGIERFELPPPQKFITILEREQRFYRKDDDSINDSSTASNIPIQYLQGRAMFCNLSFRVSKAVMIPRKGTEAVVNAVIQHLERQVSRYVQSSTRILDLGTGSGCILLSLLNKLPHTVGWGIDESMEALDLAMENSVAMGLHGRCQFLSGKFNDLRPLQVYSPFHIVVCNPPYHTRGGRTVLDASFVAHEPSSALFVDQSDMLVHYRDTLESVISGKLMERHAFLVFEVCKDNCRGVEELMTRFNFNDLMITKDSRGCIRTLSGVFSP